MEPAASMGEVPKKKKKRFTRRIQSHLLIMYLKGNHIIKLIIYTERRIGYTPCIDFTQQKAPSISSKAATSGSNERPGWRMMLESQDCT